MVNLSALNNITPFQLNSTIIESAEDIIPNAAQNANTTTDGWFAVGILIVFFIMMVITLFRQDGDIRLDIIRSTFKASGFTLVIAILMAVSNLISSIRPVLWFATIFILLSMLLSYLKSKNKI